MATSKMQKLTGTQSLPPEQQQKKNKKKKTNKHMQWSARASSVTWLRPDWIRVTFITLNTLWLDSLFPSGKLRTAAFLAQQKFTELRIRP